MRKHILWQLLASLIMVHGLAGCVTASGPGSGNSSKGAGQGQGQGAIKPHKKIGSPYQIQGRWYYPEVDKSYQEIGIASWYGPNFHGKPTANGELFDMNAMTAAHRTLPLPSIVEVYNPQNGRKIIVRVNDRGPFSKDRIIDLSREAARRLGMERQGTARVEVRYLGEASLDLALLTLGDRRGMRAIEKELDALQSQRTLRSGGRDSRIATGRRPRTVSDLIVENTSSTPSLPAHPIVPSRPDPNIPIYNGQPAIRPDRANTASPVVRERFEIQVGAFADLNRAEAVSLQLSRSGNVFMEAVNLPQGGVVYKVLLGPYQDRHIADQQLASLRQSGFPDAWIVQKTSWK